MLHELVTVIITTSAVKSNPSTDVIEQVVSSFALVPGLDECRKIFICDGLKLSLGKGAAWKSGKAPIEAHERYDQYKDNLRRLCSDGFDQFKNSEVVALDTRHGFAFGAYEGVKMATTPFVLIIQHDRAFVNRLCDLQSLIKDMDHHHRQWVEYVRDVLWRNNIAHLQWKSQVSQEILDNTPDLFTLDDLMAGKACPYPIPYPKVDSPSRIDLQSEYLKYNNAFQQPSSSTSSSPHHFHSSTFDRTVPSQHQLIYRPHGTRSSILPGVLFHTTTIAKHNTDLSLFDLDQFDSNTSGYNAGIGQSDASSDSILNPTIPNLASTPSHMSTSSTDFQSIYSTPTMHRHQSYPTPLPVHYVAMISNHTQEYAVKCITQQVAAYRGALPCYHAGDTLLDEVNDQYKLYTISPSTNASSNASPSSSPSSSSSSPMDPNNQFLLSPRLVPMIYWYDSTHIARTEFYKELYTSKDRGRFEFIRQGDFTEDRLIQFSTALIKYGGTKSRDFNLFHKAYDEYKQRHAHHGRDGGDGGDGIDNACSEGGRGDDHLLSGQGNVGGGEDAQEDNHAKAQSPSGSNVDHPASASPSSEQNRGNDTGTNTDKDKDQHNPHQDGEHEEHPFMPSDIINPYIHDPQSLPLFNHLKPIVHQYRSHRLGEDDTLFWNDIERCNPFVHGSSPYLKDLQHVALRIAGCADVHSPSEAHNVLMREWGLWLYENHQGSSYDFNVAVEPKWLHDRRCIELFDQYGRPKHRLDDGMDALSIQSTQDPGAETPSSTTSIQAMDKRNDPSFRCSHDLLCLHFPPSPQQQQQQQEQQQQQQQHDDGSSIDTDTSSSADNISPSTPSHSLDTKAYQWCVATGTRQGMSVRHLDGKAFLTPDQRLKAYKILLPPSRFKDFVEKSSFYKSKDYQHILSEMGVGSDDDDKVGGTTDNEDNSSDSGSDSESSSSS